jgi:hypothetical protein
MLEFVFARVILRESWIRLRRRARTERVSALFCGLCSGFFGEKFFSFRDEFLLLGGGQGQDSTDAGRELVEGQVVCGQEFLLPFGGAEDVPSLDGHPEDAGDIGRRKDAVDLDEFGIALRPCGEGDDARAAVVLFETHPGEHLSADGFVAHPEDEAAELHGFEHVRKGEEIGASAFDVDTSPPFPSLASAPYFWTEVVILA